MTSLEVQDASSKLAMRSVTDEDDENLPPEIPCQSQGCARIFHSEFEMREHMTKDDHRSYCFKCKLDFNGPASLFVHKVTSKKHFTCPLCKIDFHSAGGRDRHIQSNHLPDQKIACTGCANVFKTASALIKHIEWNQCPEIRISRMLLEQHRREQIASTLQERAMYGPMLGYFEQPAPFTPWTPEAADETASETEGLQEGQGGVSIEAPETTTESALTESALNQAMASLEGSGRKSGSGDSNSTVKASTSQWPAIRYLPNNARHATLEEVFRRTLRVDENGVMYHEGAEAPQSPDDLIAWEEIEEDPVDPNNPPPSGNFGLQLMPPTETMRRRMPGWNPRMHFNEEKQKFVCHACDFATIHEREFEYHIALEQRWITSTQCLQCGRIFSSTAALVAHMEQVRTRCGVRDSAEFARLLGDVTGGLIQVQGELDDGSERIVARKLEPAPLQIIQRSESEIEPDLLDEVERFKRLHLRGRA